jgi:hypothetical protein
LLPPFLTAAFHSLNLQICQVALQRLVVLQNREKRVLEFTHVSSTCVCMYVEPYLQFQHVVFQHFPFMVQF